MSLDLFEDPQLDRAIARGLSELAPEVDAVDFTLAELRPRFRRARTRRRMLQASAAIAALLVIGSAAFAEAPSARRAHVTVESPERRIAPTTLPKRTRTSTSEGSHRPAPAKSQAQAQPSTTPAPPASSAAGGSGASDRLAIAPPSTSTAPALAPPPARRSATKRAPVSVRYRSPGGSIAVRFAHGRMTLTDVDPAKGYHADVVVELARTIDVRFTRRGRWADAEIRLDVVNGHIVQSDGRHDDTRPSMGISAVSPLDGHRVASRSHRALSKAGGPEGHGGTRLLDVRTVLSTRVASIDVKHLHRSGKHGAPRGLAVPVDG